MAKKNFTPPNFEACIDIANNLTPKMIAKVIEAFCAFNDTVQDHELLGELGCEDSVAAVVVARSLINSAAKKSGLL